LCAGNSNQAREQHLQSSHQEAGGSAVLGNQTPSAPFLEEAMARRKATAEEIQRMKKNREIREKKNKLKEELELDDADEVTDLKQCC
jgi:hypothetical protein